MDVLNSLNAARFGELPGNHVLARMSHEATQRSLAAGSDAGSDVVRGSSGQRTEAVAHDARQRMEALEITTFAQATGNNDYERTLLYVPDLTKLAPSGA